MTEESTTAEPRGPHAYHFIPAVPKGELRLLQEVITLALTGKSTQDANVWADPNTGEMQITAPRGIHTVEEWQASIKHRVIAALAITTALQESELRALVQSNSGALHRIDRLYWLRVNAGLVETMEQFDGMVPLAFVHQPILVDLAELDRWREVADKATRAAFVANELGAPAAEPIVPHIVSKAESERWYSERVASAIQAGLQHSRLQDEIAGRAIGLGRERVRALRAQIAPGEWQESGRPAKLGE